MKKKFINIFFAAVVLCFLSCKKDYVNPNAATDDQVFSSALGVTGVAIGLQRAYTAGTYTSGRQSSLCNRVTINGLLTSELIVLNQGNTGEYQLQLGGGSVDGTNSLAAYMWQYSNKITYDAEKVIASAQNLSDKGYASGLIGYVTIFKALALVDMSMFWEKIPANNGVNVSFLTRTEGITKAIAAIDNALALINTTPISTTFLANIPAGIDIPNTLHALKARFSIFIGNNAQALTEANLASMTVKSVFNFSTTNLNPIFETSTSTNNVTGAIDNTTLGLPAALQPDPADKRLTFYTTTAYNSKILGFAAAPTTPWPVYLPGEMTLIKAEAYARQNDLTNGLIQLNLVVTKQPSADPYGVGAGLTPIVGPLTQAQLLDQIYKHRCIELYMSGLKLEDMRRFTRPNSEKKRNFLPYPFLERDNNPNTPPDPPF